MPNDTFYIPERDEELQEYVDSLPNKSEVIREMLKQHRDGQLARSEERIEEIDERLGEIDEEEAALEEEKVELRDERARLKEMDEKRSAAKDNLVENTLEVVESTVQIPVGDREKRPQYAKAKTNTVPVDIIDAVFENVDVHIIDDGRVHGERVEEDIEEDGFDADDIPDYGSIENEELVEHLQGLTSREKEEIEEVIEDVR